MDMDVKLLVMTVHPGIEGYGINFRGSSPVLVDSIVPGSSAEQGGLKYGDFLLELNGNDIQSLSRESVIAAIRSTNRGALKIRVGRVRPIPMTTEDKKLASQLLRNKVSSDSNRNSKEFVRYEEAVKNSLLEVEDLLGSFNLSPIKKPLPPQTTPTKHTSTEVKGVNEFAEEVEVPLYDSDSLPSPPSSEGGSSEANSQELDELLDFTRDDEFNYNPAFEPDFTKEGMEGPRMMKAMFQAKHGIEGMKEILSEVNEARERKKLKQNSAMVSSTATFTPGNTSAAPKEKQKSPQHEVTGVNSRTQAAKVESRVPSLAQQAPPSLPSTRYEKGPTSPLTSPTSPNPQSLATPTSPAYSTTKSPVTTGISARPHPLATSRQPDNPLTAARRSVSPPLPPPAKLPSSQRRSSPSPPIPPYHPAYPDRFPLSNKQEYRLEYKQQNHSYEAVDKEAVRNIQRNMESEDVATPPFPVEPRGGVATHPYPVEPRGGLSSHPAAVPFRKKRQGGLVATSELGSGYVGKDHAPTSGGSGKLEIRKIQVRGDAELAEIPITDLDSVEKACLGLPSNVYEWRHEEVHQWLYQLSPTLYKLYKPNFVKHDIIGRSLMRLNKNKVLNMGITSNRHSRVLVMEVTRLKVRQEKMELQEMQSEEQLSFL